MKHPGKAVRTAEQVLFEMLTENTGSHFLDSGGAHGRHWQANQGKTLADFENEPEVTIDSIDGLTSSTEIDYTISAFHYLKNQLEIDAVCEGFNAINEKADNWDCETFCGVSAEAEAYLKERRLDFSRETSWNSYNGNSSLSQVIQGANITLGGECYVILQLHGGCDVRGGYTNARLFKLANDCCYDGGYLSPGTVYGMIDDTPVDNSYDGYSLRDESGEPVTLTGKEKVCLELATY